MFKKRYGFQSRRVLSLDSIVLNIEQRNNPFDILDCREYKYFKRNHVKNSKHVDVLSLLSIVKSDYETHGVLKDKSFVMEKLKELDIDRNNDIYIIGDLYDFMSFKFFTILESLGYINIYLLNQSVNRRVIKKLNNIKSATLLLGGIDLTDELLGNGDIISDSVGTEELVYNVGKFKLLDVRNTLDYKKNKIENAVSFPAATLLYYGKIIDHVLMAQYLDEDEIYQKDTIVVYADNGVKSAFVYVLLKELGYTKVRHYTEGYRTYKSFLGYIKKLKKSNKKIGNGKLF